MDFFLQHLSLFNRDDPNDNVSNATNLDVQNNQDPIEDNIEQEDVVRDRDAVRDIKDIVANKLLSIREIHKVPSKVSSTVAKEISNLVDLAQESIRDKVIKQLEQEGIAISDDVRKILNDRTVVSQSCDELDSQKKLEQYCVSKYSIVEPEEIILSQNNPNDTYQYISLKETLKRLLKFKDVFESVVNNHQSTDRGLRDVVDGALFKTNPAFQNEGHTIALVLYFDEFTVSNPLRVRSKKYKILGTYMFVANVPPARRSQTQFYQLISLCQSQYIKKYGLKAATTKLYEELQEVTQYGIDCLIEGQNVHFGCELLCVVGDNLSQHQIGGFFESFNAGLPCRFCSVTISDLRAGETGEARIPAIHDQQVQHIQENPNLCATYGVKSESILANLGNWHCTTSMPSDAAHDVLEGVAKITCELVLKALIAEGYFTLDVLNSRIAAFIYLGSDKTNRPSPLTKCGNKIQIRQTFIQMWCFVRLLPLFVGDLIPENNEHWCLFLQFIQLVEYIFAPSITPGHVLYLKELIGKFLERKRTLFHRDDTPKDHFLSHYADQILQFGPLKHVWTLRLEAKHAYFAEVAKLNRCHKNICKTLARRHQYAFALNCGEELFVQSVKLVHAKFVSVVDIEYQYHELVQQQTGADHVQFAKSIYVNSILYESKCALLCDKVDGLPNFDEIKGFYVIGSIAYVAAQSLFTVDFHPHYNGYIVERTNKRNLKPLSVYADVNPLGIYSIPNGTERIVILKYQVL